MLKMSQLRALAASGLVGALALGACGSDKAAPTDTVAAATTVSIMAEAGPAGTLISEIYAQALESQGYRVSRRDPAADLPTAMKRLINGEADITFTYTDTLYMQLQGEAATANTLVPGANLTDQINAIGEVLDPKLTALPPSSAQRNGFIACSKTVAEANTLTKLSELARVANTLKLGATAEFTGSAPFSMANFTDVYSGEFKEVLTLSPADIAAKLTSGDIDCGTFASVDGTVPEKMVVLADDRAFVPHDAIMPLVLKSTSQQSVTDVLNSVSQALSTDGFVSLVGSVVTAKIAPDVVAASFLQAVGLSQKKSD